MKLWFQKDKIIVCIILLILPVWCFSADMQTLPLLVAKQTNGVTSYSLSLKIIAVMTVLTVLPALMVTTTAFARIMIVLAILRQGLGIPNVPSNQIIIGLSLIMTLFVMMPIFNKINDVSIQPYLNAKLDESKAFAAGSSALETFMLKQTRKADLHMFAELSKTKVNGSETYPFLVILPAFITSELKTAFEIGFLILIPFLIIDIVVASILMSMGMMMLSPMVISLPFKILFFVLVDGWTLLVTSLITSFRV